MPKWTENIPFFLTMKYSIETTSLAFKNPSESKEKKMKRTVKFLLQKCLWNHFQFIYFRYRLCTCPPLINSGTIKIIPPQHHQTSCSFSYQQPTEITSLVLDICMFAFIHAKVLTVVTFKQICILLPVPWSSNKWVLVTPLVFLCYFSSHRSY